MLHKRGVAGHRSPARCGQAVPRGLSLLGRLPSEHSVLTYADPGRWGSDLRPHLDVGRLRGAGSRNSTPRTAGRRSGDSLQMTPGRAVRTAVGSGGLSRPSGLGIPFGSRGDPWPRLKRISPDKVLVSQVQKPGRVLSPDLLLELHHPAADGDVPCGRCGRTELFGRHCGKVHSAQPALPVCQVTVEGG